MKVDEAIQQFLSHCQFSRNLSWHTLKAYSIDLSKFSCYAGSKREVPECTTALLRDYMKYLFGDCALKGTSVKRHIASLKVMFRWLETNDLIEINPFHRLDTKIKLPRRLPRGLPLSQIEALIKTTCLGIGMSNNMLYGENRFLPSMPDGKFRQLTTLVAIEILFGTGIRVGELVSISLDRINLEDSSIFIVGKGDRERRVFIPGEEIKKLIANYIKARAKRNPQTDILLINGRNRPASTQFIRKQLSLIAKETGQPQHITPHMFRHSTATHLLDAGVDIRKVQRLLGHQSIATTQIYTHVSDSSLKSAICQSHPRNNF